MLMFAIQLIRIEKATSDIIDFTEAKVKSLYGK
jgi:hypothetical protein